MKNQLLQRKNIRLSPNVYKNGIIHIIICTREKTPLFANKDIAYSLKQQILDLSRLKQVKIYAYVIMPDHIHLLVSLGAWATPGDYLRNIKFYDHVMRKDEDLNSTVEYILSNPVRSGKVSHWSNYPWCGSDVFKINCRGEFITPARHSQT